MSELAQQRIREAKEQRLTKLDIGNCGLTELPDELFELTWLEELVLSDSYYEYSLRKEAWEYLESQNKGAKNEIQDIDVCTMPLLKHLKHLCIDIHGKQSAELSFIKYLKNLQSIFISTTEMPNLSTLKELNRLKLFGICFNYNIIVGNLSDNIKIDKFLFTPPINLQPLNELCHLQIVGIFLNWRTIFDNVQTQNYHFSFEPIDYKDLNSLKNLNKLQSLSITFNNLIYLKDIHQSNIVVEFNQWNDFAAIKDLQKVRILNIQFNDKYDFNDIHHSKIHCSSNPFMDLNFLKSLNELEIFRVNKNILGYHSNNASHSKFHLDASPAKISDLSPLKDLIHLRILNIIDLKINDISPLKKLIEKGIPLKFTSSSTEQNGIFISKESVLNPPLHILNHGTAAILRHWQELEYKKTIVNNQTKLIFIGNIRAGKTNLWRFLKDNHYDAHSDSTHGIQTVTWDSESLATQDERKLIVNIWDFGGQEYYHATHRLFLSQNAVYVLVWENATNKQGTRLETFKIDEDPNSSFETVDLQYFPVSYWLETIQYFGGDSQRFIVQNKVDSENRFSTAGEDVSETADCFHLSIQNAATFLKNKVPYLETYYLDFQRFKSQLLKALRHNATLFPLVAYYAEVQEVLEPLAQEKTYIDFSELQTIALKYDKTPDVQNLLAYLKDFTNTILHFPQNELLKDRIFLNPAQLNQQVYKILNKTVREKDGEFDLEHIQTRLNISEADEANRFVALMKEFDLIFEKTSAGKRFFVAPQYLMKKEALSRGTQAAINAHSLKLAFQIKFKSFVTRSLMARFIAGNGAFADAETYWQHGILYKSPITNAMIQVEYDFERLIFEIQVQNKDAQTLDLQDIVKQFVKLQGNDEKIELSNDGKSFVELKMIRTLQHKKYQMPLFYKDTIMDVRTFDWLIPKLDTYMKNKILDLIKAGKLLEALDLMDDISNTQDRYFNDGLINLLARFNRNEHTYNERRLSQDHYDMERSRIEHAAKALLDSEFDESLVPKGKLLDDTEGKEDKKVVVIAPLMEPVKRKPTIYFSYAWGDAHETGESREKIVHELYESLKKDGYLVKRDKENIKYGDLISDFMKELGSGNFIVVAISDKYLKSPNCMYEMYELFKNSKLNKADFITKIYPIRVESIKLSDPDVLGTYFDYWEDQESKWETLIKKRGTRIAAAQQEQYRRVKSIAHELGNFLDWLNDINAMSKTDLTKDNFEIIKNAIEKRANE